MQKINTPSLLLPVEFETYPISVLALNTEEGDVASSLASTYDLEVYSWVGSEGNGEHLEKGFTFTNVWCFILLPKGYPDSIDIEESEDDDD